jgi:hypothetical protein
VCFSLRSVSFLVLFCVVSERVYFVFEAVGCLEFQVVAGSRYLKSQVRSFEGWEVRFCNCMFEVEDVVLHQLSFWDWATSKSSQKQQQRRQRQQQQRQYQDDCI